MKIASAKVSLKEQDMLEVIKKYVRIENLKIENIVFDDKINIECTYKKGIKINLQIKIQVDRVSDNVLYFSIVEANIGKIHILNKIKDLAVTSILKEFEKIGLNVNGNMISLKIETLCKIIPSIKFILVGLDVLKGEISAEVKDLLITNGDEIIEAPVKEEIVIPKEKLGPFLKTEDKYTSFRMKLLKKIPDKYIDLAEYVFLVPDILILFGRLLKDKRVPTKNKIVIGSIVAYFASPIDFGMLFIPFVGDISVVALAFYGLSYVMEKLPEQIIMENWQGNEEFALKVKDVVKFLNKATGGSNIDKLLNFSKITSVKVYSKK